MNFINERREMRSQSGFTLIELLVVIAILGILAAVVVFAVGGIGDKGKASACKIDSRTIKTAEQAFSAQAPNGQFTDVTGLIKAQLLDAAPTYHNVWQSVTAPGGPGVAVPAAAITITNSSGATTAIANSSATYALSNSTGGGCTDQAATV